MLKPVFHGFLTHSDREGSLIADERRRLTRIIKNDNSVFNFLIKMKCQHVIPSAQETGKEFSLGQRVKTMVTVD